MYILVKRRFAVGAKLAEVWAIIDDNQSLRCQPKRYQLLHDGWGGNVLRHSESLFSLRSWLTL